MKINDGTHKLQCVQCSVQFAPLFLAETDGDLWPREWQQQTCSLKCAAVGLGIPLESLKESLTEEK